MKMPSTRSRIRSISESDKANIILSKTSSFFMDASRQKGHAAPKSARARVCLLRVRGADDLRRSVLKREGCAVAIGSTALWASRQVQGVNGGRRDSVDAG